MTGGVEQGIYADFFEFKDEDGTPPANPVDGTLYSLDANILLNLYKFLPETTEVLLRALQAMQDSLFVSHQAMAEFWKLRDEVRSGGHHSEAAGKVRSASMDITRVVDIWKKRTGLDAESAESGTAKEIDQHLEKTSESLEAIAEAIDYVKSSAEDGGEQILDTLEKILRGRVGVEPSPARRAELEIEFDNRIGNGLPPGNRDVEVRKGQNGKAIGDFLVWTQSIDEAQTRSTLDRVFDLTIVTEDHKDDWTRSTPDGSLRPRRELVKEYHDHVGGVFRLASFVDLLEIASAHFGAQISDEAKAQVRARSSDETSRWTSELVELFFSYLWNRDRADQLLVLIAAYVATSELGRDLTVAEGGEIIGRDSMRGFAVAYHGAMQNIESEDLEGLDPLISTEWNPDLGEQIFVLAPGSSEAIESVIAHDEDYENIRAEAREWLEDSDSE